METTEGLVNIQAEQLTGLQHNKPICLQQARHANSFWLDSLK